MKIEDQVCSLELAKQLKELGFEQKSLFWWCEHENEFKLEYYITDCKQSRGGYSAYTVAEVLNKLPKIIHDFKKTNFQGDLYIYYLTGDKLWVVGYKCDCPILKEKEERLIPNYCDNNLADAGSELLIYLKQNNLI